jgi:hypothetical protein
MPMTGYDRDAELVRPEPGPKRQRYVLLAAFIVAVIVGALLGSLAKA